MLLTITAALLLQTPEPQWREFKALGWTASLAVEDVQTARRQREAAKASVGPDQEPNPWYVVIRTQGAEQDGERPVVPRGFICGRGHVDGENGINPITPHTMEGEIYDLVCYGEGEQAFLTP